MMDLMQWLRSSCAMRGWPEMGHYVSFWGVVPGRDIDWGPEADSIKADVKRQCDAAGVRYTDLLVMVGGSARGVIQTKDGRRFFVGSSHGLIELPAGMICPHRTSIGYHGAGEIPCPICGHGGIRLAAKKLGWVA